MCLVHSLFLIGGKSLYNFVLVFDIQQHDIKRSKSESGVARWMNLEPLIQREVRKRKTNVVH